MFAITGVTGNTGAVVAETLLAAGKAVRVIVRDAAKGAAWKARGAEVAVADVTDLAALTAAFRGASGAYVLSPPRHASTDPLGDARRTLDTAASAARAAAVPHVVLLSSVAAHHPDGTGPIAGLHHGEKVLAAATALTAVRAAYFVENWGAALGAVKDGVLPTFVPHALRFPMVSTRDIGRTAAAALLEGPPKGTRVIELAGPEELSADDVAAVISRLVGREIKAVDAPLDAVVPTFTSFGLSAEVAGLYREMYAGIASGRVAWEGGAARAARGTVPVEETLRGLLAR
jgi:uncharacterized protein YbjT (DUF2867 family)